jgi:hypothetical protein
MLHCGKHPIRGRFSRGKCAPTWFGQAIPAATRPAVSPRQQFAGRMDEAGLMPVAISQILK